MLSENNHMANTLFLLDLAKLVNSAAKKVRLHRKSLRLTPQTAVVFFQDMVQRWSPNKIALVCDDYETSWRSEIVPTCLVPKLRLDDLYQQTKDWFLTHGASVYECPGYWALDIMATIAERWDGNLVLFTTYTWAHQILQSGQRAILKSYSWDYHFNVRHEFYLQEKLARQYWARYRVPVKIRYEIADYHTMTANKQDHGYNGCPHLGVSRVRDLLGEYGTVERVREELLTHNFYTRFPMAKRHESLEWLSPESYIPKRLVTGLRTDAPIPELDMEIPPESVFRTFSRNSVCESLLNR
jgi:hypothetical protein